MPKDTEGYEKLRLLGQLAGDDVRAITGSGQPVETPNWDKLQKSGQITGETAALLAHLDTLPAEYKRKELQESTRALDHLIRAIVTIEQDNNAVAYIAQSLIDACKVDSVLWNILANYIADDGLTPHMACYKALERNWQDTQTNDALAYLLCGLQSHRHVLPNQKTLWKLVVDSSVPVRLSTSGRLAALSNLLKDDGARLELFNSSTVRGHIVNGFLSKQTGAMYHATVSFWLITFQKNVTVENGPMWNHRSILDAFCEMVATCKREKVIRVTCYALKNLVDIEWVFEVFFLKKLDHTLTLLEYEKWRDQDLYETIQEMIRLFYQRTLVYSNFNRYIKELDSGRLRAGPLHTEKFWRENVKQFEDNEFSAIRKLSALLHCDDPETLSVAAFDLGEFCRLHPTGRRLLQKFGAKDQVIKLMSHPNKEVAREALLCTQKFMLDDWRKLGDAAQEKHQKQAVSG